MRKLLATLAIGGALAFGAPNAAEAQTQDGLVNVVIADNVTTVNIAAAVDLVVQACNIQVGPLSLAVLGRAVAVDRSGRSYTVCRTQDGPVRIEQNT